jgi:hypothetical protein
MAYQLDNFNLVSDKDTPKYCKGKVESLQPIMLTNFEASKLSKFIRIILVLLKYTLMFVRASKANKAHIMTSTLLSSA